MDSRRKGHRWQPIENLPAGWPRLKTGELDSLHEAWQQQRARLQGQALEEFTQRLVRRWSIETGILERVYKLSEGVTLTLVELGFDASLIPLGESDLPPAQLVRILEDHREAAEGLFAFVRQERALSTSYIKELHSVLTRHQDTCEAVDSLGRQVEVKLVRGEYKKLPNNPGDPSTGEVWHEYCPPEHVAAEMDRLVEMHLGHGEVPYEIEAAWLHHRFTQVHPFQDGNGRGARALATLVCVRAGAFPLLVSRHDRTDYLRALETADDGDLEPLVRLFRRLLKSAFLKAVQHSEDALDRTSRSDDIEGIASDAKRRIERALLDRVRGVQEHAVRLRDVAFDHLQSVVPRLRDLRLVTFGVTRSQEDERHWFKAQIVATAKHFDYFANLTGRAHWARLRMQHRVVSDFVVSLHHQGRVEDGVMVATAFLAQRDPGAPDRGRPIAGAVGGEKSGSGPAPADADHGPPFSTQPACDETFTFTAGREPKELEASFRQWLERAVLIGLDAWRRGL